MSATDAYLLGTKSGPSVNKLADALILTFVYFSEGAGANFLHDLESTLQNVLSFCQHFSINNQTK